MELLLCANCGAEITEEYYRVLDNYLQVHYFDEQDGSDNLFCSKECLCDALSVQSFDVDD